MASTELGVAQQSKKFSHSFHFNFIPDSGNDYDNLPIHGHQCLMLLCQVTMSQWEWNLNGIAHMIAFLLNPTILTTSVAMLWINFIDLWNLSVVCEPKMQ